MCHDLPCWFTRGYHILSGLGAPWEPDASSDSGGPVISWEERDDSDPTLGFFGSGEPWF